MSRKKPRNASEVAAELQGDANYQQLVAAQNVELERQRLDYRRDSEVVMSELAEAGYQIESIQDLVVVGPSSKAAMPILAKWLPRISNSQVKEAIVRTMSVPWAGTTAREAFLAELEKRPRKIQPGILWAIASGIEVVADSTIYERVRALVADPDLGKAREMLLIALGKTRHPEALSVLDGFLDNAELAGHALMGLHELARSGTRVSRERVKPLTKARQAWVRKEARRLMKLLDDDEVP